MTIQLKPIGTYKTGVFDESAAEIVAYDATTKRLFVVNANSATIDVLDVSGLKSDGSVDPTLAFSIDVKPYGEVANSVDVQNGIVAVAVENADKQAPGSVVFFDTDGTFQNSVTVGALPDMLTFTPDGQTLLVANEGEPNDDYDNDPVGSISVIDISGGVASATVQTAGFDAFVGREDELRAAGVRIFGPNANAAQDFEPEYIAVSPDGTRAFAVMQENNAIAVVDVANAAILDVVPLGFKDYNAAGNAIDASNRDNAINFANYPVLGMYQPDAIDSYTVGGQTYYVTANEGDSRDYDGFSEEARVADLTLDPTAFPNAAELQDEAVLGRLNITTTLGDDDGDGDTDRLFAYGGRSFSIWDSNGNQVFDSGNALETLTAQLLPENFNSTNDENGSFDNRSDDKGPEPEAIVIGEVNGKPHAFIGLERIGGVAVYDISNPTAPEYVTYVNNRDFSLDLSDDANKANAVGLGPEGLAFVDAIDSPTGKSLLAVSSEVSGDTTVYEVGGITQLQILHTSDLEGGVDAIVDAPNFAAVVEGLEAEAAASDIPSILLSAGDNYLPGPFFSAAGDSSLRDTLQTFYSDYFGAELGNVREGVGRIDISVMNALGFDASAVGNHEFDAGTSVFADLAGGEIRGTDLSDVRWPGAQFPYLSANLDFANSSLRDLYTSEILSSTDFAGDIADLRLGNELPSLAPATVIERNGDLIGVIGATTPVVGSISSTGDVNVIGSIENDMAALAAVIQPTIDALEAQGVNKIVTLTHLQQFQLEQDLIPRLSGVDVAIAGGSDTILADSTDRLRTGDTAAIDSYPVLTANADGEPAAIVSSDGQYNYVGRLVVEFDGNGVLIPSSIDPNQSGAYATDDLGVSTIWNAVAPGRDPFAEGTKGETVDDLTGAAQGVVTAKDGQIFGASTVYLEGRRSEVRTEETNLGNLTADANLFVAKQTDPSVVVSLKNGGGIRDSIGEIDGITGELEPTSANPLSGKQAGQVSQLDIEGTLRFNNGLTLVTLTAEQLKQVIEHGVAESGDGATPGRFPQVGGIEFSFDTTQPAGSRVQSLAIVDAAGNLTDVVVQNGAIVGDAGRTFRTVTLDFLAGGGDGYPYPDFANANPVDLEMGEQAALGQYIQSVGTVAAADTEPTADTRIQNLARRSDTVLDGGGVTVAPTPDAGAIGFPESAIDKNRDSLRRFDDELEAVFDDAFYLANNPDVVDFNGGAIAHFVLHGQFENRAINATFRPVGYLASNPDVSAAVAGFEFTATAHYVEYGIPEGRPF